MDWKAVSCYFNKDGVSKLVDHQIESFEDFINNKIPLIVCSTSPIVVWHEQDEITKKYKYEFRLSFENVTYMKPRIQEASHMQPKCFLTFDLLLEVTKVLP